MNYFVMHDSIRCFTYISNMVFRAICICLLLWFSESAAQQEHKRVLIAFEGSVNLIPDRQLLSGERLYDRTRSRIIGGITVAYSLQKRGGVFDPYVGASFSRMVLTRRYLAAWPTVAYFFLPWENQILGTQNTISGFLGCRIWAKDEEYDLPLTGLDIMTLVSSNRYEGLKSEEFETQPVIGVRLGLLARYPYFQINPFVQFHAVPSLERKYSWNLGKESGAAISRHGRVLVGLQLGVCF